MALVNIETAFLDKFKAAHVGEFDLSSLAVSNINVSAAVLDTAKYEGAVVSNLGSPIRFNAVSQSWNAAKLSALIMDGYAKETDPALFTSGTQDSYVEGVHLVLRLNTLTGVEADDLVLIKERLGVLTNYDFSTAGSFVNGGATPGLVFVDITDNAGTALEADTQLEAENFSHVYALDLGGKIFDTAEVIYVVAGDGVVQLTAKDLGDVATKQEV